MAEHGEGPMVVEQIHTGTDRPTLGTVFILSSMLLSSPSPKTNSGGEVASAFCMGFQDGSHVALKTVNIAARDSDCFLLTGVET